VSPGERDRWRQYIREGCTVDPLTECWNWNGYAKSGYGYCHQRDHSSELAHQVSYRAFKCEILKGMVVRHTCDNGLCCNPSHLRMDKNS